MRNLSLISLVILVGCAYPNEIRVTEYGAGATLITPITGEVGGCRVVTKGSVKASVTYDGEKCSVRLNP